MAKASKVEKEVAKEVAVAKEGFKLGAVILPIAIAVLFLILLILGINVKLTTNDELNLILSPLDSSFFVTNDMPVNVSFNILNNNRIFCKSECEYSLSNLGKNKILQSGSEVLGHNQNVQKSFMLLPPGKGSGQAIYNFNVKCKNIKTFGCFTDESPRYKSSIVSIN